MKYLLIVLLLCTSQANAGLYVDAGVMAHVGDKYSYRQFNGGQITGLMGQVEVGYEKDNISVFVQHTSIITNDTDSGINLIGIRVNLWGK